MSKIPVRECVVPFCTSVKSKSTTVTFHEFPSDLSLRQIWLKNINRQESRKSIKPWTPNERSLVCGAHFDPLSYREGIKIKRLKKDAAPTIFPNYPIKAVPKERKRRHDNAVIEPSNKRNVLPAESGENNVEDIRLSTGMNNALPLKSPALNNCSSSSVPKVKPSLWGNHPSPPRVVRRLKNHSQTIKRLTDKVKALEEKNSALKKKTYEHQDELNVIKQLKLDASNGSAKATILLEQLTSYGKRGHSWSDLMLRHCVIWRSKSSTAYEYARTSRILNLPCKSTLHKYLGPMQMDAGLTPLIRSRLVEHVQQLKPMETYTSLIFDEMAIKPMCHYNKKHGRVLGTVNCGKIASSLKQKQTAVANRLLCFVLNGISTKFTIPVAYFFVRQLIAEDLVKIVNNTLYELEEIGFRVIRLVADDYSVNQKAFKILSGGEVAKPQVENPANSERPLFLAYDYCHVFKSIRRNFQGRSLKNGKDPIDSNFLVKLKNKQDNFILKAVRSLTRKMLEPTNFEKMKVVTALRLFGNDVIAALELMNSKEDPDFLNVQATIDFMKMIRKWWEVNDVCSTSSHRRFRNKDKESFWKLDDARLRWLEFDFIQYLDDWKASTTAQSGAKPKKLKTENPPPKQNQKKATPYLTRDTDAAIRLTTLSTVMCIKYLIRIGYQFVLTRRFSGDSIEYFFSGVRQMGGGNDQMDQVSCMYALEKITKVGIVSGSLNSNVGDRISQFELKSRCNTVNNRDNSEELYSCALLDFAATVLEDPPEIEQITLGVAGAAFVAGHLCKLAQSSFPCPRAVDFLLSKSKDSDITEFIKRQDHGGLLYPSDQLVSIVVTVSKLFEEFWTIIRDWKNSAENFARAMTPPLSSSGLIVCGCESNIHNNKLQNFLMVRLARVLFQNKGNAITESEDRPNCKNKPLSRKVLKFS